MMNRTLLTLLLLIVPISCASAEDAALSNDVRVAFSHDPVLVVYPITVTANNRIVYLSGLVSTGVMRERAGTVANAVPGVSRVVNGIALQR